MSASEKKPRPSLAVLQWLDKQGVDLEESIKAYSAFEEANVLGNRIGRAVWLTESVAGNLARGTIGRRQAVEMLREIHQALFELGRDLGPACPPQSREQFRWNHAAGEIAPWQPPTIGCENAVRYGNKPEKGAA
jgi:hypothetical protein